MSASALLGEDGLTNGDERLPERSRAANGDNPGARADGIRAADHAAGGTVTPSIDDCTQPLSSVRLLQEAYSTVEIATRVLHSSEVAVSDTTITYVATAPERRVTVARDRVVVPNREFAPYDETTAGSPEALKQGEFHPEHSAGSVKPLVSGIVFSQPSASHGASLEREKAAGVEAGIQSEPTSDPELRTMPLLEHLNRQHGGYLPIQDYGVVGNLSTVALCGIDGSIDFLCYPRFDSPTIFGRMLDSRKGGFFQVSPTEPCSSKQLYLPNSNVLVTRFLAEGGVGQTTDFMPVMTCKPNTRRLPWLMRKVEVVRGELEFRIDCFPSFDYARVGHTTCIFGPKSDAEAGREPSKRGQRAPPCDEEESVNCSKVGETVVCFTSNLMTTTCTRAEEDEKKEEAITEQGIPADVPGNSGQRAPSTSYPPQEHSFRMSVDLRYVTCADDSDYLPVVHWVIPETHRGAAGSGASGPGVSCTVKLSEGHCVYLVLREVPPKDLPRRQLELLDPPLSRCLLEGLLEDTIKYWRGWADNCTYKGRWREEVVRSALALKLMTYADSGAMVAAPTCSLPEGFGGERNWDYRHTWIRDAAFTVYAFIRIGFTEEAHGFMDWIERRCREMAEPQGRPLQIMYGIDGQHMLTEEILSHLDGYRSSRPVRVGNGAYSQLQLDIYGELMDSVYLLNKYGSPIGYDLWLTLVNIVNYVCDNYHRKDEGIWEVRGGSQHFVYSKVMSWVAIDRGLRLADKRSFPAPRKKWYKARDTIYTEIMEKGWSRKLRAFKQAYDNETLDAANLIMPLCFFISPSDPRLFWTLEATLKPPHRGGLVANNLCFRYNIETSADGLTGEEGTFSICSFWLVEALTRSGKYHKPHLEQALAMFEQTIGYGNHLGLFAEQIAKTGEGMGNFPQAFTHLALISAAFNLDRVLG